MTKFFFVSLIVLLFFTCLCLGGPGPEENVTSTTKEAADNSTTTLDEVTTTTEEVTSTTEEEIVTTTRFVIDSTTSTTIFVSSTKVVVTTSTTIRKSKNGEKCYNSSECASGRCVEQLCCSVGQCVFGGKCYSLGQARQDKRLCQSDGSWKKNRLMTCYIDSECVTGLCTGGLCCNILECGSAFVGRCYAKGEISFDQTQSCMGDGSWKKVNEQPCRSNSECSTDFCSSGYCCAEKFCGYNGKCYADGYVLGNNVCSIGAWKKK